MVRAAFNGRYPLASQSNLTLRCSTQCGRAAVPPPEPFGLCKARRLSHINRMGQRLPPCVK